MPEHFGGHSGSRPWRDVSRRNDAGIGKAGLFGYSVAAFDDVDLVSIAGQLVGRGDADDAGADNCYLHITPFDTRHAVENLAWIVEAQARQSGRAMFNYILCWSNFSIPNAILRTASSQNPPAQTMSPTGNSPST